MTSSSELLQTVGSLKEGQKQADKKIETLYTLHNGPVSETIKTVERITDTLDRVSKRLDDMEARQGTLEEKQVACQAARETEKLLKSDGMNKLQKWSIWAGILTFIGTALSGAVTGIYLFIKYMIEHAK